MTPLVLRTSLRYLARHPWQLVLSILGIALGVAVVVAIDLANGSARRAFTLSTETITGRATHQVVGGSGGIDERIYGRLRDPGLRAKAPVVDGYLTVGATTDGGGRPLRLLGVDPFSEGPFRSFTGGSSPTTDPGFEALLTLPNTIILSRQTAADYGVDAGGTLAARAAGRPVELTVVGLIDPADDASRRALDGLAIADIAAAQEVLDMVGRLSRIDLIVDAPAAERLRQVIPPDAEIATPAARSATITQLTAAFETNLTALSLLALVVGMFLIYNTITFSVVQRRGLLGTLRCLGVTRRQIFALIILEAVVVGLIGALVGIAIGIVLGRGLVGLVTQTINDLYFAVTVREVYVAPATLIKGMVLGVGATVLAAAIPAREATLAPPRAALRRSSVEDMTRVLVPRLVLAGVALFVVGGGLLLLPTRSLMISFVALFCFVVGSSFLTPALTVAFMRVIRPILGRGFGLLGRMAARDVIAALSRTSVAIAALMVAVSVTVGVGVMVSSFRETVVVWLNSTLEADIYISPPGLAVNRVDATLDPRAVAAIRQTGGVVATSGYRGVITPSQYGQIHLMGLELAPQGEQSYAFVGGDTAGSWSAWRAGGALVSEPFAYRHGVGRGDTLTVRTPNGERSVPVVGVVYDYASEQGGVVVPMTLFRAWYGDLPISSMAAYVAPGDDVDQVVRTLQSVASPIQELDIRSNVGLRTATLEIFDRTFAITGVLQLLATIIAFVGILSALMALQLERARELGVMRANGLTPRQVWGVVLGQTGLMGLTAGLLSLPVGLMVATVLVYIINRRSFGWTLRFIIPPTMLGEALILALVAALLAGLYPAYRMARTSPAIALREE